MPDLQRRPLSYPDAALHHVLDDGARKHPESIAVVKDDQSWTFRELAVASNALAGWLAQRLHAGDRIVVSVTNSVDWLIAVMAASKAGCPAVLVNPRWNDRERAHALELTRPRAVITDDLSTGRTGAWPAELLRVNVSAAHGSADNKLRDIVLAGVGAVVDRWPSIGSSGETILVFSSGTTGMPKAVVHTHRSIVASIIQWRSAGMMRSSDRLLLFLPLFHVYGLITACASLSAGARLILMERFDAQKVLRSIERDKITITFGAAPVAHELAAVSDIGAYNFSSLRYFVWGATSMAASVAQSVTKRTGISWLHAYGATEAPLLHCNPVEPRSLRRIDTVGVPVSDVDVRIVDVESREPLFPGEVGEILVKGPQLMSRYIPHEPAFEDGWLKTGDLGWVEQEGWLHVVDRVKELIKVSGFQVAPAEIESLLLEHPAVSETAVFAIPDYRKGELPVAAVVLASGQGGRGFLEDLRSWVNSQLSAYKQLAAIYAIDKIPKTPSGKVLRRELKYRQWA